MKDDMESLLTNLTAVKGGGVDARKEKSPSLMRAYVSQGDFFQKKVKSRSVRRRRSV